ncbi:MAG TPA: WcbI family polysaccharide biosynthesis putative acetyltransferase [Rhizomicrobium sp.]|nr:WcbI family polysaccharide biosynthesis putative acetyltransferase [Rhizomicrobium sp.]
MHRWAIGEEGSDSPGLELAARPVLPHLTRTGAAISNANGSITAKGRRNTESCFLYGPHWWLRAGRYRLSFRAQVSGSTMTAQPSFGVEIVTQNRFRHGWRDFTQADANAERHSMEFLVPQEMGTEQGQESRFEFRFFHFANGAVTISDVILQPVGDDTGVASNMRWRLLGRLGKGWTARRLTDGSVAAFAPGRTILKGGWPYLRLASGRYRLTISGSSSRHDEKGVLAVRILGRSHWRRLHQRVRTLAGQNGLAETIAMDTFTAGEMDCAALTFDVPEGLGMDTGEDAPFEIRLGRLGSGKLRIDNVVLDYLGPPRRRMSRLDARPASRRTSILVVGNCQADIVCSGFRLTESLNRRYAVKYHFVKLQDNLLEAARADLAACDLVLAQDISDWRDYPLREAIPAGIPVIRFPMLGFASLWPFDHYNGPGDQLAHAREWPNLTFTYLDGLLARLRREIPDPEARFRAYAALDWPGIVNYRRLHELEAKRLKAVDASFGGGIGTFILDNFRKRQLFYTTNHPNGEVLALLLRQIVNRMGGNPAGISAARLDALHPTQVPVHPKVAADLGVRWATADTRYLFRGEKVRWEDYVRRYIAHYG